MIKAPKLILLLALTGSVIVRQAAADEVLVAVASNFTAPMEVLASEFEQQSGHQLNVVFGSSGRLYAQIRNGAPFQIFLSADQQKPQQLEQEQLIVPGSRFTYASGVLVLWSANEDRAVEGSLALNEDVQRLAIANPQLAPYGQAAIEVLSEWSLLEAWQGKLVRGENIAQAFQFVYTGNAEIGFVALSQVGNADGISRGVGWIIPEELHKPILQDAIQLRTASECGACAEFLSFLNSETAQHIIRRFGYR